jgi:cob(I)alamin adenosyltransferase
MTKFYTRRGDDGFTGMLGKGRIPKYHPKTEAVGVIDEATAAIGAARAICTNPDTGALLIDVQRDLYHIMAEIAAAPENTERFRVIDQERIDWLEAQVDRLSESVGMPAEFILPGDSPAGSHLALARTVVRRAERRVAELYHTEQIANQELLRYLNRLSSLCFVLELDENQAFGKNKHTLAREK